MLAGWLDLGVLLTVLLARCALVAGVALATYTMLTRGFNG
jgi:hypothetical protein